MLGGGDELVGQVPERPGHGHFVTDVHVGVVVPAAMAHPLRGECFRRVGEQRDRGRGVVTLLEDRDPNVPLPGRPELGTRDEVGKEFGLMNPPLPENGQITPPTAPGWGAEWDWEYFERKRIAVL